MATIKVKFRKSTVKGKAGTVYYQICHASQNVQITTNIHILPEEWDDELETVRSTEKAEGNHRLQKYRLKVESDVKQIQRIIKSLDNKGFSYTISDIKKTYLASQSKIMVLQYMEDHIEKLKKNRHYGTAKNYQCALNSFSSFLNGEDISFSLLNEGLVMEYNDYLESKGIVKNSISFYMRIWRAVYNRAVKERIVEQDYPFCNVYTGIDRTRKRAVDEDTIKKLIQLDLKGHPGLELSRDMFVFSYCTRGMAFIDIAYLKKSNIEGTSLVYNRRKTNQLMIVKIEPCIRYYIDKYKIETEKTNFIFPLLEENNEKKMYKQYMAALSLHNLRLKKLSELIGISTPLSSYMSRHTWATTARNYQVPLYVISAGMGHSSEKTTEIYLASVDNTLVNNANRNILENLNELLSF